MSWEGYLFIYLPGELEAVPAGRLVLEETGPDSTASRFGYGRRYLARPHAVPVDPQSLPLSCMPATRRPMSRSIRRSSERCAMPLLTSGDGA